MDRLLVTTIRFSYNGSKDKTTDPAGWNTDLTFDVQAADRALKAASVPAFTVSAFLPSTMQDETAEMIVDISTDLSRIGLGVVGQVVALQLAAIMRRACMSNIFVPLDASISSRGYLGPIILDDIQAQVPQKLPDLSVTWNLDRTAPAPPTYDE